MKKILLTLIASLVAATGFCQEFYLEPKINVASACIAILNPAVELGFCDHSAVEYSNINAFAKESYLGTDAPLLLSLNFLEYRYYMLNKEHRGLFVGADLGWGLYKTSKTIFSFMQHINQERGYDWGESVLLGVTIGYKFLFKERFGLEISASGGWQHTNHEPYYPDGTAECPMNKSGEWLPYKAGVYFSYRFNCKLDKE
ncbi:MAG: DUF3575 domain-containing protein [Rikenellaceae bacterium]